MPTKQRQRIQGRGSPAAGSHSEEPQQEGGGGVKQAPLQQRQYCLAPLQQRQYCPAGSRAGAAASLRRRRRGCNGLPPSSMQHQHQPHLDRSTATAWKLHGSIYRLQT